MGISASQPSSSDPHGRGPYGFSRTTSTEDVIAKLGVANIEGKFVVITGANGGLGFETARCLAAHGAIVTLCARSEKNGQAAVDKVKQLHPEAKVSFEQLDLSSHSSIRAFSQRYIDSNKPLHILVNNAGVMACPKTLTADGLEQQMGVNHVGHFLLTSLLLPLLESSGTSQSPARVICVSSMANYIFSPRPEGIILDNFNAEKSYNGWTRYGESKLANILFAKELDRRMKEAGKPVVAVALHPGVIMETELAKDMQLSNQMKMACAAWAAPGGVSMLANSFFKKTNQGAATQVMLCVMGDIEGGKYYVDCGDHESCAEGKLHPMANDPDLMRRLWSKTEEVIADIQKK